MLSVNHGPRPLVEQRPDQHRIGFATAQSDGHGLIDAHRQWVLAEKTVMQHFDARAFDRPHFQQAAFDLAVMIAAAHRQNAPDPTPPHQTQGLGEAQPCRALQIKRLAFRFVAPVHLTLPGDIGAGLARRPQHLVHFIDMGLFRRDLGAGVLLQADIPVSRAIQ